MNWRDNSMDRVNSISRMALRVLLAGCLLAMGSAPAEAKSRKSPKSAPSPTPEAAPEKAADDKTFNVPIPINHDARGIRIPIYSLEGKLQMLFESEIAFRVDVQQLRLTQLKIETYDDAGQPEMAIEMPNSLFDLQTRILSSVDPVTIRRTDFEVTGANMTFDTQTSQGKFTGPVRMLIFNVNAQAPTPHKADAPTPP